jgi:hypothetical protein
MNNEQQTMNSFMQNKPNLQNGEMNISPFKTMNYELRTMNNEMKNKPKTKPIQTQSYPPTVGQWGKRVSISA